MRWKLKNGQERWQSDNRKRIDWNKRAPSAGAQAVKEFLYENNRQDIWFEEYPLPGRRPPLRVDFLNATKKFAIEFQGRQHSNFVKHFHGNRSGFIDSVKRDYRKIEFLEMNGYKLIEIFDSDLPLSSEFFAKFGVFI